MDFIPAVPCLVHGTLHFPAYPCLHNTYGRTEIFLLVFVDCQYRGAGSGNPDGIQPGADLYDYAVHGICGGGIPDFAGD